MFVRTTATIPSARLEEHFADLTDPRSGAVTDPLLNLVVSAIGAELSHTQAQREGARGRAL